MVRRSALGWTLVGAGLVAVTLAAGQMYNIIAAWSSSASGSVQPAPVAVILGDTLEEGQVGPHFQQRLDRALELYRQGVVSLLLVSGGGHPAEADVGKEYLIARGIPAERILTESQSCSTLENIKKSKQVLAGHRLNGRVLLITNGFHLSRALMFAREWGLDAQGVPAEPGRPRLWNAFPNILREATAVAMHDYWSTPGQC